MMLPDELEWVLKMLGYNWPTANEDLLRDSAQLWRTFGDDVQKLRVRADTSARTVVAHNAGESIEKFATHYKKFSNGSDGYLSNAAEAAYIIANTFEAAAYLVEFAKYAVIVQLIALAIQIAAAAAASVVTFGLSAAAGMAATQITRLAVRRILDALKDALMEAIIEAMKEPAVSAVQAMVTDLVRQSVNVGFGAQEGFDLSKTVSAGAQGGWEALKQTPQTFAEGVRDGLGKKAGSSVRDGIDSGYNSSMDAYNNRSNPTAGDNSGDDGGTRSSSGSADGGDSSGSPGSPNSSSGSNPNSSNSSSSNSSNSNSNGSNSSNSNSNGSNSNGSDTSSSNGSNSSGPDSTTTSRPSADPGHTNIGGGISADGDGPAAYSSPDLGNLPSTDTGSSTPGSSPSSSDSGQNPSSSNSSSRPTLSDFDDPAPGNTAPSPTPDTSSSTPSAGDNRGGSATPGGLTSPTPQAAPTPAAGSTPSSTGSNGSISTSIDSLAASIPTQSNAAPAPTTADPSTAAPRPDGNSSMPASPTPPSTADGATGARTGTNTAPGGPPSGNSPTGPNPSQGPPRAPSATPGIPNPTGTGPASTPSPTPSTPPRSTPTPSTDGRTPGTTPGSVTSPSQNTPGGAHTRTPGAHPTTPGTGDGRSPNPNQPAPGRAQNPNTPNTTPGGTTTSPGLNTSNTSTPSPPPAAPHAPGRTPDSASTPNSRTPGMPSTPSTANQPGGAPNPSPGNQPQQPGSQPNTPQNPQPNPANTSSTPNQQQQQQVTAVPIHTVAPAPSGHTAQPTTPTPNTTPQPGQNDNAKPTPAPASATRDSTPPGGVTDPTRAEQDALDNSVPRDENGDPTRPPDPADGPWVRNINGDGHDTPGRNNNCVDTALSTVDTYAGNPTAAGARTPDPDAHGNPSDRGEKGGRDRMENTLGARFSDMGNGRDAFNRLENTLRNTGHGSQAVIITQDANGRAHAWNAVNHNGKITYIDAQTGRTSPSPLHSGNNGVFAIPLDGNRQPVAPAGDGPRSDADQNDRRTPERPGRSGRRPDAEPAGTDSGDKKDSAEDPKDGNAPHSDKPKYSDPHDRGESDTSDESRRVTAGGPDSDVSRTHEQPEDAKAREYGIEPDVLQQKLRQNRDVHRVELDRVHERLSHWASNDQLANVLRETLVGDPNSPRSFTRDELTNSLDGFGGLSRGEQQAVVASLARLSLSFHEGHSVGNNPDSVDHPYRGENEGDATEGTKDWGAKNSEKSLGVQLHEMARNQILERAAFKNLPDDQRETVAKHGPDFSGKNFAVLEVKGPPPKNEITYVVDSSVPANQNLPGVKPRHSETHLLDWLKRVDPKGELTPLGLYTEREPCGKGQGHMKCSNTLQHERFKDVPIHYSTTYRDAPDGVAERKLMSKDKRALLAELKKLPDDDVRQRMTERWSEQFKDDPARLQRALNRLEGKSGTALTDSIGKELDAQRKENRTDEERAVTAEFDRHIDVLQEVWEKLHPQLIKPS